MRPPILLIALVLATPAGAQVRTVPAQPASAAAADAGVDVFLVNEGNTQAAVEAPATLSVTAADGTPVTP